MSPQERKAYASLLVLAASRRDTPGTGVLATGALMSVTSSQQGESIPGIAHAVVLESPRR